MEFGVPPNPDMVFMAIARAREASLATARAILESMARVTQASASSVRVRRVKAFAA